jgi:SP family sugar:H+ symporter-like MFS transporter
VDEMFAARLPARKFRGYVCVGRDHVGGGKIVGERDGVDAEKNTASETVWTDGKAGAGATLRVE